ICRRSCRSVDGNAFVSAKVNVNREPFSWSRVTTVRDIHLGDFCKELCSLDNTGQAFPRVSHPSTNSKEAVFKDGCSFHRNAFLGGKRSLPLAAGAGERFAVERVVGFEELVLGDTELELLQDDGLLSDVHRDLAGELRQIGPAQRRQGDERLRSLYPLGREAGGRGRRNYRGGKFRLGGDGGFPLLAANDGVKPCVDRIVGQCTLSSVRGHSSRRFMMAIRSSATTRIRSFSAVSA